MSKYIVYSVKATTNNLERLPETVRLEMLVGSNPTPIIGDDKSGQGKGFEDLIMNAYAKGFEIKDGDEITSIPAHTVAVGEKEMKSPINLGGINEFYAKVKWIRDMRAGKTFVPGWFAERYSDQMPKR